MNDYYLPGYQTQRSEAELAHGSPVRHDVVVKVNRPRLSVRTRNGYPSTDNEAKATPRTAAELLQQALFSPRNAGSIALRMESLYSASSPDPKTKVRSPILGVIVTASGPDLTFAATAKGLSKLDCDVLVAVFQEDGAPSLPVARAHSARRSRLRKWLKSRLPEFMAESASIGNIPAPTKSASLFATALRGRSARPPGFSKRQISTSTNLRCRLLRFCPL
jgi:hypothetical protein